MTGSFRRTVLAGAVVLAATACKSDNLNVPDFNRPTVSGVGSDPVAGTQLLATGVLLTERNNHAGFIDDVGIFGRESYNYFPTDARNVSHYLIGQAGPSGTKQIDPTGFASGNWGAWYGNMKNETNLMNTVKGSTFSDQQKNAALGFARTFFAFDLYHIVVTRDSLGGPIKINDDATQPAAWASRDAVWTYISALLDSAAADLQAGGAAFPFTLHSGFTGYDAPATFLKFNRALAARVLVNRGSLGCATCYQQALTVLPTTYIRNIATTADLDVGPQHIFSGNAGDVLNGLNIVANNNRLAHAAMVTDAQKQPDGVTRDDRSLRKVAALATPRPAPGSGNGITANYFFQMYAATTTPITIIRNEELVLLRAEAKWKTNDLAGALADLNMVRTVSGKLAPLASLGADPTATLLYEREMSLMWEGHRWNDVRRFGRLSSLPIDQANHFVARVMPVPKTECDARPHDLWPPVGC